MKKYASLALFILIVMGGGAVIGTFTSPGDWYASLEKPFFNPPNWVFGPVWSILYLAIAFVGWRVWHINARPNLMRLWVAQLCLNFLWSPLFFIAQKPGLALIVIMLTLVAILALIKNLWRVDRLSAMLFLPYAMWVGFASMLNGAVYFLNFSVLI